MKALKRGQAVIALISVMILLVACGNESKVKKSAEDYVGNYYNTVAQELSKDGFKNVQTVAVEDITSDSDITDGSVESVAIDGNSTFAAKEKFASDAEVIITYHKIPTATIPINADDIQMYPFTSINKMLTESGFSNVTLSEVYDLDPDTTKSEYMNEVTVDGSDSFKKGDTMVFDAPVSIVVHYPYEKYTVKLAVDFIGNWIFNTYDVDVYVDGARLEQLAHGTDGTIETRVQNGEHTISFVDHDDRSIKGTVSLDVTSDVEAGYQISCHTDYVQVTEQYTDYQYELAEGEIKLMNSRYGFVDRNYKEVVTELEGLGFTNIKTVPQYDIYWGFTPVGSVANVAIDGDYNYSRGDVFKNDAEIKVFYHLMEDDDPAKKSESATVASSAPTAATEKESTKETVESAASTTSENNTTAASSEPNSTKESTDDASESEPAAYYTSNSKETFKNGNSGQYAYHDHGSNYWIYYIFDFDAGYVYRFIEGNNDSTCDRVKISSGDLNHTLIITYHAGDDTWQEGFCFKRKNMPDNLIYQDKNGYTYDFYATDLDDALDIMATKEMVDY